MQTARMGGAVADDATRGDEGSPTLIQGFPLNRPLTVGAQEASAWLDAWIDWTPRDGANFATVLQGSVTERLWGLSYVREITM